MRKIRQWSLKEASSVLETRRSACIGACARIFGGTSNREDPRGTHRLKNPPKKLRFGFPSPLWTTRGPEVISPVKFFLAEKRKWRLGVLSAVLLRSAGGFRASDQFNARAQISSQALQHMTRVPVAIRASSSSLLLMARRLNRAPCAILLLLAKSTSESPCETRHYRQAMCGFISHNTNRV